MNRGKISTLLGNVPYLLSSHPRVLPSATISCRTLFNISKEVGPFDNYEKHRKLMRNLQAPEYFNFATDVIDQWAAAEINGTKKPGPAFWWLDDYGKELKWSFQQVSDLSKRFSNVLIGCCGLQPGDKLISVLPKVPEWWIINIAAIRSGIILSPGTILLRPKDIEHRLKSSGAKCIIADDSSIHNVQQVADVFPGLKAKIYIGSKVDTPPGWLNFEEIMSKSSDSFQGVRTKGSDTMTLFFTSGTTGSPKMAEHTYASYGFGHLLTARYMLQLQEGDIVWNLADPGWAKCAWTSVFATWLKGSCVFVHHTPKFDPVTTLKVMEKVKLTHFCGPPTAYRLMVKERLTDYKSLQKMRCVGAGEPVNPELLEEWSNGTNGSQLYEGFGQTETTYLCGTYPCIPIKPGSMGKEAPGIDLEVVDDEGNVVPYMEEGNIGVRCKPYRPVGLFKQYVDDPKRTQSVHRGDFYLTGDRGYMDEDRYLWFVGRDDDVIITSGYRVGPFEVESALLEHPAVLESAVVSSPDPDRGEVVKAFVTLSPHGKTITNQEQLKKDLQEVVKGITAPYKYPRKIEFVDQLPKTVSGKIRRVELREAEHAEMKKEE